MKISIKNLEKALSVFTAVATNRYTKYTKSVLDLESQFSAVSGCDYNLSMCNATSAFNTILDIYFLNGKTIAISNKTFYSIFLAILARNCKVIFYEINDFGEIIWNEALEGADALVVTHLYGYPISVNSISQKLPNCIIIEDCSHSHGAEINGIKVGSIGHVAIFSLQGEKPISGSEGGMFSTKDLNMYELARGRAHMGRNHTGFNVEENISKFGAGVKYRMHPLAANLALVDLKYLKYRNDKLRRNWQELNDMFSSHSHLKPLYSNNSSIKVGGGYLGYPVKIKNLAHIKTQEIFESGLLRTLPFPDYKYILTDSGGSSNWPTNNSDFFIPGDVSEISLINKAKKLLSYYV